MLLSYSDFKLVFTDSLSAHLDKDVEVDEVNVNKVNENGLDGLCLRRRGEILGPTFYVDHLYEHYKNGNSVEDIVKMILRAIKEVPGPPMSRISKITDFESVNDCICLKLINRNRNEILLKDRPFVEFLDLAVVFYVCIEADDALYKADVSNELMELWGKKKEDIIRLAAANTKRLNPVSVFDVKDLINTQDMDPEQTRQAAPLLSVGSQKGMLGAIYMMDSGLMQKLADLWKDDLAVIPSSVHEVLVTPAALVDTENINDLINEVNSSVVSPADYLSDHVYFYNRHRGKMIENIRNN